MRGRRPRWRWLTAGASGVLAATALASALAWASIFDAMLASQMALSPTSLSYHKWVAPTVPIFLDIYMFNWTNAQQFPREKPRFEQLGPYRFREVRQHVNVTFHPHNSSVAYRTMRSWHFDSSSNGSLDDAITTLNVIAASAIFRSRHWGFLQQKGLSMGLAMFGQRVSVSKTAGQMLFEGYEDPLLDLAKSLPASTTGGAPPVDRFGWFYGRNNSIDSDGYVEVSSGAGAGSLPGQILKWNYQDSLPFYKGKCSEIAGSAGEFLPRNLDQKSTLTMFVPDLCRTVAMDYVASGELDGLGYHKFAMLERSFDHCEAFMNYARERTDHLSDHPELLNGFGRPHITDNCQVPLSPENACFCDGECMWGGVMNVSACRFGSPAFLSLPHFLHADPELRENVEGMRPDPDEHSFYFAVEPKLGVPLDVAARFQFNVYIEPSPNVGLYEDVPRMLFPVFWVQQKVQVSEEIIKEIRMVRILSDWGGAVCASLALAFTALAVMAGCCYSRPEYSKPKDLIANERPKDEAELKLNPK